MSGLSWHYGVFREKMPKQGFRWRDLKTKAQALECDYVSVIPGRDHYWLGFATTAGIDAAAILKAAAAEDATVVAPEQLLYIDFGYGYYHCVHWQGETLQCCQSMELGDMLAYLSQLSWPDQSYAWLHLPASDPVGEQVKLLNPQAQTRLLNQHLAPKTAQIEFVPLNRARANWSPWRRRLGVISSCGAVMLIGLWWLQDAEPAVVPAVPIDLDAKRFEHIAQQGLSAQQLSAVGGLIDVMLKIPGWELQQLVVKRNASGFIWLRLAPTFGDLATLRSELAHLPVQWQFESSGVILHYPLDPQVASNLQARDALQQQLPLALATQVEWLLSTVPVYVKHTAVQVASETPQAYQLQSRPIVLSLQQAYSQDLDALLGLLRVLPARIQGLELRFQGPVLDGEITATLFNYTQTPATEV